MTPALISSLGLYRIAAVSVPVRLADPRANAQAINDAASHAVAEGADVILTPELSLTGYTLGDLVRNEDLLRSAQHALSMIAEWSASHACVVIVGLPMPVGSQIYNVAAAVQGGAVRACVPKTYLPSSNEFYEHRWYTSGAESNVDHVVLDNLAVPFGTDLLLVDDQHPHVVVGIEICEDLWAPEPPSGALAAAGATLILNPSASNELVGKADYRRQLVQGQSGRTLTAYAYASSGPTESVTDTVFSGHCMIAERGSMVAESQRLEPQGTTVMADVDLHQCLRDRRRTSSFQSVSRRSMRRIPVEFVCSTKSSMMLGPHAVSPLPFVPSDPSTRAERCREILQLQGTALAMRWRHTGSQRLVLGLSGGLDSTLALLACMQACQVLDRPLSNILAVSMPGPGTTQRTRSNAEVLANAVGCEFRTIPIHQAVEQHFSDIGHDPNNHSVVFENAQARERTQILMDLANSVSGIVVGTGDMSELALGWCTYNADQMSMYGVNAGVPKTLVRHVIEWYASAASSTAVSDVLTDILDTPISPELLPPDASGEIQQRTEDHLGPYEVHDFFLYHIVRLEQPIRTVAILAMVAFDGRYSTAQIIEWCEVFVRRFFTQQFKRSAMPDGVKIGSVVLSPRADWRMPSDAHATAWLQELATLRADVGGVS